MDPAALAGLLRAAADAEAAAANARMLVLRGAAELIDAHFPPTMTGGAAAAAAVEDAGDPKSRKRQAPARVGGSAGKAAGPAQRRTRTADPISESVWQQHYPYVLAWRKQYDAGNLGACLTLCVPPRMSLLPYVMTKPQADALTVLGVRHLVIKRSANLKTFMPLAQRNTSLTTLTIEPKSMIRLNPTVNELVGLTHLHIRMCDGDDAIEISSIFELEMLHDLNLEGTTTGVVAQLHRFRHLRKFENGGIHAGAELEVFYAPLANARDAEVFYAPLANARDAITPSWRRTMHGSTQKTFVDMRTVMMCRTLEVAENVLVAKDGGTDFDATDLLRYRTILRCAEWYWGAVPLDVRRKIADATFPMCEGIPLDFLYLTPEDPDTSGASGAASSVATASAGV